MKGPISALALLVIIIVQIFSQGSSIAYAASPNKNYALPSDATDISSIVSNDPNFMVTLDEGGSVPSEAKATCDNLPAGSFKSIAGVHFEHYFPGGKLSLDQKVDGFKRFGGVKMAVESEYDKIDAQSTPGFVRKSAVTMETVDGAEAGYYTYTVGCVENANPTATHLFYFARLINSPNWIEITVNAYATTPDKARKYAHEILLKAGKLDYAAMKSGMTVPE